MIIVRLMGGLGNQMFQYAAGRQIAHRLNTTLKLDTSFFTNQILRSYSLDCFHIEEQFASNTELLEIRGNNSNIVGKALFRAKKKLKIHYPWTVLYEKTISPTNKRFFSVSGNVYLDGYWQSQNYFTNIAPIIRRTFQLKDQPEKKALLIGERINKSTSISLHIRRGDYIENPVTNAHHGTCNMDYYLECVTKINQLVNKPHFFVFTDDPIWAEQNIHLQFPTTFVSQESEAFPDYVELWLMSLCQHHIIANSSFSWWGAWLNPSDNKLIFAPKKWFRAKGSADLIPQNWIQL